MSLLDLIVRRGIAVKSKRLFFVFSLFCSAAVFDGASAASLVVSPISLEAAAPQQTVTITLRNSGNRPINGQVRVFVWRQEHGEDVLEPTQNVVCSPPMAEIGPGAEYTIRVVRIVEAPIAGEESYRLVVDEIPDATMRRNGIIAVALRYVIPIFFYEETRSQPRLSWFVTNRDGGRFLVAKNEGDRRAKISALSLNGKPIANGLAGYALGHSERRWKLPGKFDLRDGKVSATVDREFISVVAKPR
ncbi:hypothetical protein A1351_11640 [Methylosinus sp. R-45379]|uniref:fimbrial biogenesis chaperone n=1 Tax=unclassified Methylosinus TaxID=2624500 RepID=UPI0007D760A7|nr:MULTISPECIES: molecular chaperone [unclassified Methylosinus]OAI28437.1 hypothetical protein A1351_11640 [Methylosinus sp. R-45379]